jgi:hypothetical protein
MALYKDLNNNIHDDDNGKALHLLPQGCVVITQAEADAVLQSKVVPPTYQQLRAAAYPPVTDYMDGIVKGDLAQQQVYIDACLAVKAKYPKPI